MRGKRCNLFRVKACGIYDFRLQYVIHTLLGCKDICCSSDHDLVPIKFKLGRNRRGVVRVLMVLQKTKEKGM
uniref:Uncharacterized protein n=1 Tax=Rhizophora mucronata TaxID=61149 RepID=A0A2P2MJ47_RHIMU